MVMQLVFRHLFIVPKIFSVFNRAIIKNNFQTSNNIEILCSCNRHQVANDTDNYTIPRNFKMNNSFNYHKSDFHHTRSPTHNTTFITTKFPTLSQSTQSRRTGNALHITAPERNVIIYNLCNIQTYKHTHQKYATVHSSTGLITSEHGTRSDKFIGRLRDSLLRRPITFPARLRSHLSQLVNVSRFLSV